MDRKAIARQTLDIMEKGWYETEGTVVEIRARQQESVKKSVLFTPEQGERLLGGSRSGGRFTKCKRGSGQKRRI